MTDQNPPDDDDPGPGGPDPMEKYGELFREKADGLEAAGRKVGLYIRDAGLSILPMPADDGSMMFGPVMVANFNVGDQAWSDRVQNAEQYTTEAEFRKMAVQMEKDKFEETRAELERRMQEGEEILGTDDDD